MRHALPDTARLTILIVARNAASTIARAVESCLGEDCPIILVDDHSSDDTVGRTREVAGGRVRIERAPHPGGVGVARQHALDCVRTEFAAWLDADDEWLPGRAGRLERMLRDGSDIAGESIDLHDGPTGLFLRRLVTPAFLRSRGGPMRLFERNFLPGDTQIGFRTSVFRDAGGFDPAIYGPETFDVLLRCVMNGARFAFGDDVGYRMYAYPGSVSRNLPRQRAALADALRKHDYTVVRDAYLEAGCGERVAAWGLVMMAQFRGDTGTALRWLEQASPADADPATVLEPEGPWPFPEGWRRAFHRGTILLAAGSRDAEAEVELRRAESLSHEPESANNLGVALARTGREVEARAAFSSALRLSPGYLDASLNLFSANPSNLTSHPLRREASRSEYSLSSQPPPASFAA